MAYIPNVQQNTGNFVPSSQVWDISQLNEVAVTSPEFKELIVRLYQQLNNIAVVLNLKDTAYYLTEEFNTSGLLFNPDPMKQNPLDLRPIFRKEINFGQLPAAGTVAVPHGIAPTIDYRFVKIYGAATDPGTLTNIPLPYPAVLAADILEVYLDNTNVYITTGGTNYNGYVGLITVEYVKF